LPDGGADALALDDRAFTVIAPPPRRRVLVVGGSDLYLEGALLSFGAELVVERVPVERVPAAATLARYDAVIFDGVAATPAPTAGRLLYLDPHGPGGPFPERGPPLADPLPTELAREHPLLAHLALADLNIREARRLRVEPDDQVVAGALGVPLLVARSRPGLRLVALSFDPRRSDLPLRPTFPLLLANALDWLADRPARGDEASERTGTRARLRIPGDARLATVIAPDGARARRPVLGGWLELPLAQPGHYRVEPEAPGAAALAVAASFREPSESDLAAAPAPWFLEHAQAATATSDQRAPLDAAGLAGLAALALLVIEWWSYHRRWTV
jgi:hypothetical protein